MAYMEEMNFETQPLNEGAVNEILHWRYDPPYDIYNITGGNIEDLKEALLNPRFAYYQITNEEGELVAFCNFGLDARVPGGDYSQHALDIGLGVRPDLTGRGMGQVFIRAVLHFAQQNFKEKVYRVTIAKFNLRAQRAWERAGFTSQDTFTRENSDMQFVILTAETGELFPEYNGEL
jgi:ribosomal-protein-alanine N-acetyltransferase